MMARAVAKIAVNDTMVPVEACYRSACFGIKHESYRILLYTVGGGVKPGKSGRLLLRLNFTTGLGLRSSPTHWVFSH